MIKRTLFALIAILSAAHLFGQPNKEKAFSKEQEAIDLMDKGKIAESIKLLEESVKLDPDNLDYPYEIAYAHYIDKNYQKSLDLLEHLIKRNDGSDKVFQLLGNSYDNMGKKEKAIEAYEAGLTKFPNSGKLHLELGGMYLKAKNYDRAIYYFEKGIEVEPSYPSNYYRVAKMFLNSDEEVWGMIYGELFINLERNSPRSTEISKMLYDTYEKEINFTSDTSFTVSFSVSSVVVVNSKKIELPFGVGLYEPALIMEMVNEKSIDIHSLDRIRTGFVKNYFVNKRDKKYPNVLFDYQNKILKEGHLEAYNHWVLMHGDEEAFEQWKEANTEKWETFVAWFNPNGLKIDDKNKFLREQY